MIIHSTHHSIAYGAMICSLMKSMFEPINKNAMIRATYRRSFSIAIEIPFPQFRQFLRSKFGTFGMRFEHDGESMDVAIVSIFNFSFFA